MTTPNLRPTRPERRDWLLPAAAALLVLAALAVALAIWRPSPSAYASTTPSTGPSPDASWIDHPHRLATPQNPGPEQR